MNFFNDAGQKAIGSRVRLLAEKITVDASQIYRLYDIRMAPKWFPVFYILSQRDAMDVTTIAKEIGHSHPSVSKIVREMAKAGYLLEKKDKSDGRRNVVQLSAKGKTIITKIQNQYTDVQRAVEDISRNTKNDLWEAIAEWENLLEQKTLLQRVKEVKRERETRHIRIIGYTPKYKKAFRSLNEAWIKKYFKMEKADYAALENPKPYILDKGGHILIALSDNKPVGACALISMNDKVSFEMAKMAVAPEMQGKGLGYLLGKSVIEKAKALGAKRLYLESNTILKPAISLYRKLGFKEVEGPPSPYERSNIQMELML